MNYESKKTVDSIQYPGVRFKIWRISFGRRLALANRVREIGQKLDFHRAGNTTEDAVEAAVMAGEIDRLYLEWGFAGIEGIGIDGQEPDAQLLADAGPEDLSREIIAAIKHESCLSQEERKN